MDASQKNDYETRREATESRAPDYSTRVKHCRVSVRATEHFKYETNLHLLTVLNIKPHVKFLSIVPGRSPGHTDALSINNK